MIFFSEPAGLWEQQVVQKKNYENVTDDEKAHSTTGNANATPKAHLHEPSNGSPKERQVAKLAAHFHSSAACGCRLAPSAEIIIPSLASCSRAGGLPPRQTMALAHGSTTAAVAAAEKKPGRKPHYGSLDTPAPSCPVRHAIARRGHARQVFDETPAGGSANHPPCLRWPCQPARAVLVNSIPSHNCAATPRWYFIPSSTALTSSHLVRAAVPLQWDGHSDPSISML
jgi:hypothetical protein